VFAYANMGHLNVNDVFSCLPDDTVSSLDTIFISKR